MSRIGKKPVPIPDKAKLEVAGAELKFSGPKGNLVHKLPRFVQVKVEGKEAVVTRSDDSATARALHGTTRAIIANHLKGVTDGYKQDLEIYGTGYTAKVEGGKLMLNVGFMGRGHGKSAQFIVPIPKGVEVKVEIPAARGNQEPAKFSVSGADKQAVGQFAAEVRKIRKPEPYQGKGIRYAGEQVRRKAGKVFAGGT